MGDFKIDTAFVSLNKPAQGLKQDATADPLNKEEARLREVSKKMEAQFLNTLVKAMEKTVPRENNKQNMVSMMFSGVMSKAMAEQGGIGMADFIYNSLKDKENPDLSLLNQMPAVETPMLLNPLTDEDYE